MSKAAEFQGTCAVCMGTFKVRDGLMVLHGYLRPGDGYIAGRCFGEGRTPWEVSPEAAQAFLDTDLKPALKGLNAALVPYLTKTLESLVCPLPQTYEERKRRDPVKWVRYTPASPEWEREFQSALSELQRRQQYYTREVADFEARIAAWKPGTLKPITDVVRYVTVAFVRGCWYARSVPGGRTIEWGRLLDDVLARAARKGWTLHPETPKPEEYRTSALYRMLVEKRKDPETAKMVGRPLDPAYAQAVVDAYATLTPEQQANFDRRSLSWVARLVTYKPIQDVQALIVSALG